MQAYFDHERLEVYQVARSFNRELSRLLRDLASGHSDSKDNLKRAAKSVTRNIAEGSGKWAIADKVHFYHIARGSVTECAASLDELVDFELVETERINPGKEILGRVVAMLTAMIRSIESREAQTMGG